ncbi:MAG TPA: hypothetical protein VM325_03285 [Alphaproteobacteria bacterium]|nr:hypothetical protein [Alphaproteobacteria bacterium]
MKTTLIILTKVVTAIWLKWGTLDPCSALKKGVRKMAIAHMAMDGSRSGVMGGFLLSATADRAIDTLGPGKCIEVLWRIHVEGERPFK